MKNANADQEQQIPIYDRLIWTTLQVVHDGICFWGIYIRSRRWSLWPLTLPAAFATILTLMGALSLAIPCTGQIEARITQQLNEAVRTQDVARRDFCAQALQQRFPDN